MLLLLLLLLVLLLSLLLIIITTILKVERSLVGAAVSETHERAVVADRDDAGLPGLIASCLLFVYKLVFVVFSCYLLSCCALLCYIWFLVVIVVNSWASKNGGGVMGDRSCQSLINSMSLLGCLHLHVEVYVT